MRLFTCITKWTHSRIESQCKISIRCNASLKISISEFMNPRWKTSHFDNLMLFFSKCLAIEKLDECNHSDVSIYFENSCRRRIPYSFHWYLQYTLNTKGVQGIQIKYVHFVAIHDETNTIPNIFHRCVEFMIILLALWCYFYPNTERFEYQSFGSILVLLH